MVAFGVESCENEICKGHVMPSQYLLHPYPTPCPLCCSAAGLGLCVLSTLASGAPLAHGETVLEVLRQ